MGLEEMRREGQKTWKDNQEEKKKRNDNRRQKMVEAAFFCFSNKGIEVTSIADIAREAEVGEATVYRYFGNKENIVLACGVRFWTMASHFMEVWTNTLDFTGQNGMEQVETLIWGAYGFYQEHREDFKLLHNLDGFLLSHNMMPEQLQEYKRAVDRINPCLFRAIEKGKRDGSISRSVSTRDLYYAVTMGILSVMEKMAAAGIFPSSDRIMESDRKLSLFLEIMVSGLKCICGRKDGA